MVSGEDGLNRELVGELSPVWTTVTAVFSALANTPAVVGVVIVVALAMRLIFGRWAESIIVVTAVLLQAAVFLLTTMVVDRQRPAVEHLDPTPPTSSFPSGHTGAATALYVGICLVQLKIAGDASACWGSQSRSGRSPRSSSRFTLQFRRPEHPGLPSDCSNAAPPSARPRIADRSETGRFTPNPLGGAEARSDGSVVLVQRGFDAIGPLAVSASRHAKLGRQLARETAARYG